jgi:anti-anti-sigma factor
MVKDIIAVIKMSGELTVFTEEFDLLYKEILAYMKLGVYRFVLDFNDLNYLDSSGLGLIIRLAKNAAKHELMVCVICDQPQIRRILDVSNVNKIIRFVRHKEEGVEYFLEKKGGLPKSF